MKQKITQTPHPVTIDLVKDLTKRNTLHHQYPIAIEKILKIFNCLNSLIH